MKRLAMVAGLMGSLFAFGCGTELPADGDTTVSQSVDTQSISADTQSMLACTRTTTQAPCGIGYTRTTDIMYCPDINYLYTQTICVKCSTGCSVTSVTETIGGCQHTYGACL